MGDGGRVARPERRAVAGGAIVVITLGVGACARSVPSDEAPTPAVAVAPAAPPPPVDHLAPGELVEGDEHAFGVALPHRVHVEKAFAEVVYARADGDVAIHPLAKYFRSRLEGGSLDENDTSATFEHVHVRTTPGREYSVHIAIGRPGPGVELRDTTPPPAPNLPDEAARWKQVGLTPQGKVLDPKHFE